MHKEKKCPLTLLKEHNRRQRLLSEGKCVGCRGINEDRSHIYCSKCLLDIRTRTRVLRQARKDDGICIVCGFRPLVNKTRCNECRLTTNEDARRYKQAIACEAKNNYNK